MSSVMFHLNRGSLRESRKRVTEWLLSERVPLPADEIETVMGEAFTNAIRHAYAGEGGPVRVTLNGNRDMVISDLGAGFDPEDVTVPIAEDLPTGGMGIALIRGIVEKCGGRLDIHSRVGSGSSLRLVFAS